MSKSKEVSNGEAVEVTEAPTETAKDEAVRGDKDQATKRFKIGSTGVYRANRLELYPCIVAKCDNNGKANLVVFNNAGYSGIENKVELGVKIGQWHPDEDVMRAGIDILAG